MKGHMTMDTIIVSAFVGIILFSYTYFSIGQIGITITGLPQIDSLSVQLAACQAELKDACPSCPECVDNGGWEFLAGMLFGGMIGFLWFIAFSGSVKGWLIKTWTEKKEKPCRKN